MIAYLFNRPDHFATTVHQSSRMWVHFSKRSKLRLLSIINKAYIHPPSHYTTDLFRRRAILLLQFSSSSLLSQSLITYLFFVFSKLACVFINKLYCLFTCFNFYYLFIYFHFIIFHIKLFNFVHELMASKKICVCLNNLQAERLQHHYNHTHIYIYIYIYMYG